LPLGKTLSFGAIRVNTRKYLAVTVNDRNLPMLVFPPSVFAENRTFPFRVHVEFTAPKETAL
jgi:hypothetical protein